MYENSEGIKKFRDERQKGYSKKYYNKVFKLGENATEAEIKRLKGRQEKHRANSKRYYEENKAEVNKKQKLIREKRKEKKRLEAIENEKKEEFNQKKHIIEEHLVSLLMRRRIIENTMSC